MTDHFCENSQRLKVVSLFSQKGYIKNARLGSKYASKPYMTYLSKTCVSTKKMVARLANKKYLKKQQIVKKKMYKQKQQTYLPNTAYLSNQI